MPFHPTHDSAGTTRSLAARLALGAAALAGPALAQSELDRTTYSTAVVTQFTACAPAPANGAYALGYAGLETARLLHLDEDGNVLWARTINYGFVDVEIHPAAIVTTASGGCIAVGTKVSTLTNAVETWIHAYEANGTAGWTVLDSDPAFTYASSLAIDASHELFVGYGNGGLKKFTAWGSPLWSVLTPPLFDLASDGAGGVFACGRADLQTGNRDPWVGRFDGLGNTLHFETFGSSFPDDAKSIAADGVGGYFVLGTSAQSFGGVPDVNRGCWLQRRNGSGIVQWSRTFGSVGQDHPSAVALDAFGGVIAAGHSAGGNVTGPNPLASYDSWIARFDPAGALVWGASVATSISDRIYGLAVGSAGDVFVAGAMNDPLTAFVSRFANEPLPSIGVNYCGPAVPNSTGAPSRMAAFGSAFLGLAEVRLVADSLPAQAFGYFLTSQAQGFTANPGGSQGHLCLGGAIGRFVAPGQIQNAGASGQIRLLLDLSQHPTPNALVQVQAGETWNFQAWYRDLVGGAVTSNLSDAISVSFF